MAHKNFAYSTVLTAPSPASSGTSLVVQSGDGAKFSLDSFRATVWPIGVQPTSANAEIVTVTAISTDTFTIVRAQESSSARSIIVGDQIAATETASMQPSGIIMPYVSRTAPVGWLNCDGSTVSRTTYAPLFANITPTRGTFTVTVATPAVVTNTAHGLSTGDQVFLTTTSALPTGLVGNTLYYVIRVDADSFNLATTRANAYAATKIATSGTQSGVHTLWDCPFGLGDGSTTFTLPDFRGRVLAGLDTTAGTAASRLTLAQTQGVYGNIGSTGGEQGHTPTLAELFAHSHTPSGGGNFLTNTAGGATSGGAVGAAAGATTDTVGSSTAHNNVQPIQLVNYIVKT